MTPWPSRWADFLCSKHVPVVSCGVGSTGASRADVTRTYGVLLTRTPVHVEVSTAAPSPCPTRAHCRTRITAKPPFTVHPSPAPGQVGLGPTPPSHKRGRQGDPWADALEDSTHTLHRAQFKALSWLDQAKLLERWGAPVCVLSGRCECPLCM